MLGDSIDVWLVQCTKSRGTLNYTCLDKGMPFVVYMRRPMDSKDLCPQITSKTAFIAHSKGFPGGAVVKNPRASAGDTCSVPESGRSPGEGNGNPLQYSCLGNPMDRGTWWATVHGV